MSTAVTTVLDVVSSTLSTIEGDATLMAFFCAGIIGVAINLAKRLRS